MSKMYKPLRQTTMTAEVMWITPEMAAEMLSRNVNFRKLRPRKVEEYTGDLQAGAWDENGESIKFDTNGDLRDGQHRLSAIVKSNVGMWVVVVRGIKPTADKNIDRGMLRSFAQILTAQQEKYTPQLAGALQHLYRFRRTGKFSDGGGGACQSTVKQLLVLLEANPEVRSSVAKIDKYRRLLGYGTAMMTLHYLFSEASDSAFADEFFDPLFSGLGLTELDARYHLRNRLIQNKVGKAKLLTVEVTALVIKAWNAFVEQRPVKHLRFSTVGNSAEEYPVIMSIKTSQKAENKSISKEKQYEIA